MTSDGNGQQLPDRQKWIADWCLSHHVGPLGHPMQRRAEAEAAYDAGEWHSAVPVRPVPPAPAAAAPAPQAHRSGPIPPPPAQTYQPPPEPGAWQPQEVDQARIDASNRTWDSLRVAREAQQQAPAAQPQSWPERSGWQHGEPPPPKFIPGMPWEPADDDEPIPPREWLLGTTFCKHFLSGLTGRGGVGKTALRIAQAMSVAIGRSLTGEHIWRQANTMFVSFEDTRDELRRRARAAMKHHNVSAAELKGRFFVLNAARKLAEFDKEKGLQETQFAAELRDMLRARNIEVVCVDPFVKIHGVNENDNNQIDFVIGVLSELSFNANGCAVDSLHHENKGRHEDAADRGRGASAFIDGGRLMYALSPMSEAEADMFGVPPAERAFIVRYDRAKVNIGPPDRDTMWFRLVGVKLGNGAGFYPAGDTVQTVERWYPPNTFDGMSTALANQILDVIAAGADDGQRYSKAAQSNRAAWRCVNSFMSNLNESQCKAIVKAWLNSGLLYEGEFKNDQRKSVQGLFVDPAKRPGNAYP